MLFANQALFDLLTTTWRTDTALEVGQEKEVLAHLHALAAELTPPAGSTSSTGPAEDASDPTGDAATGPPPGGAAARPLGEPELLGSDPRVRALGAYSSTPPAGPAPPAGRLTRSSRRWPPACPPRRARRRWPPRSGCACRRCTATPRLHH
jgi:hypothetical protein